MVGLRLGDVEALLYFTTLRRLRFGICVMQPVLATGKRTTAHHRPVGSLTVTMALVRSSVRSGGNDSVAGLAFTPVAVSAMFAPITERRTYHELHTRRRSGAGKFCLEASRTVAAKASGKLVKGDSPFSIRFALNLASPDT